MNDTPEALIRLVGKDLASTIAEQVNASLEKVVAKQDAATKATEKQADAVSKLEEGWKMTVTGYNNAISLFDRVATAVGSVRDALREAAVERVALQGITRDFGDADAVITRLATATGGRVEDSVLVQLAAQAGRLGITLEQTAALANSATRAAAATGRDVTELARELLKNAGEGSDEMLRQLGVLTDIKAAQRSFAMSIGSTTDTLTRQQAASSALGATVQALNEKFGELTGDNALARIDQAHTAWANMLRDVKQAALDAAGAVAKLASDTIANAAAGPRSVADATTARIDEIRRSVLEKQLARAGDLDPSASEQSRAARDRATVAARAEAAAVADLVTQLRTEIGSMQATRLEQETAANIAAIHARDLARVTEAMGDSRLAADLWTAALAKADAAHISVTSDLELFERAMRGSNDSVAQAIALQAELASAAGDEATAEALRANALAQAGGETKSTSSLPANRTGGSRPKADNRQEIETARSVAKAWENAWQVRDIAQQVLDEQQTRLRQEANARIDEEAQRVIAERQRIQQEQAASQAEAYRATSSAADQLTSSLQSLGGVQIDLRPVADNMQPLIQQIEALKEATDSGKGSAQAAAAGIVASSLRMTTGLVKNETARAAIMALVETAEGFRSIAMGDVLGGTLHFASAGIYGTVAGMSLAKGGGGSGGGGSARSASTPALNPAMTASPSAAPAPPVAYNLYLSGATIVGSNEAQVGRDLARILRDHGGRSAAGSASPR